MHKDQALLIGIWAAAKDEGLELPWAKAAELISPELTGDAVQQHIVKVRTARLDAGLPVPPLPGRSREHPNVKASARLVDPNPSPAKSNRSSKNGTSEQPVTGKRSSTRIRKINLKLKKQETDEETGLVTGSDSDEEWGTPNDGNGAPRHEAETKQVKKRKRSQASAQTDEQVFYEENDPATPEYVEHASSDNIDPALLGELSPTVMHGINHAAQHNIDPALLGELSPTVMHGIDHAAQHNIDPALLADFNPAVTDNLSSADSDNIDPAILAEFDPALMEGSGFAVANSVNYAAHGQTAPIAGYNSGSFGNWHIGGVGPSTQTYYPGGPSNVFDEAGNPMPGVFGPAFNNLGPQPTFGQPNVPYQHGAYGTGVFPSGNVYENPGFMAAMADEGYYDVFMHHPNGLLPGVPAAMDTAAFGNPMTGGVIGSHQLPAVGGDNSHLTSSAEPAHLDSISPSLQSAPFGTSDGQGSQYPENCEANSWGYP